MDEIMNDNDNMPKQPISTVRFGLGKEIQLYSNELIVTGQEQMRSIHVSLESLRCLTLVPGDPTPSKLVLLADLDDGSTTILAEGMTNAKDFREMLPKIMELCPDLELDPPDMAEQLRQALNNRRAWSCTCYGCCLLLFLFVIVVYFSVVYIGSIHH
jgi:hypothetical protein